METGTSTMSFFLCALLPMGLVQYVPAIFSHNSSHWHQVLPNTIPSHNAARPFAGLQSRRFRIASKCSGAHSISRLANLQHEVTCYKEITP
ncbi:uncharacterized protein F5891DRAFT_1049095 [Suillus fuscotomentosus]|uniref:Secreted protein n=1 Tax=Suillus fuscotomentosus TaxID=1912939 RepID=A0AAD4E309_9AGAM|nr:uncharacterized protein F5891DRAFT_1049095 [Suillus fuscotomentosus]KAG1897363.1 hypothetical protein F5891DRAFT_1049095 [Suillus fuscotomentosus]